MQHRQGFLWVRSLFRGLCLPEPTVGGMKRIQVCALAFLVPGCKRAEWIIMVALIVCRCCIKDDPDNSDKLGICAAISFSHEMVGMP